MEDFGGYKTLKKACTLGDISKEDLRRVLGITIQALNNKLMLRSDFKLSEALTIKLFLERKNKTKYELETLFKYENEKLITEE